MLDSPKSVRSQLDPTGTYAESMEVAGTGRLLFISGQVPTDEDGTAPADFGAQCRNSWRRVLAVLDHHDMRPEHLVKVTTFLRDRADKEENRAIRQEVLGDHRPALTVIVADLFEDDWRIEIEAIATA